MVRSPGVEPHLDAFWVEGHRTDAFLSTSPEFHMKRLLSAGFSKIYQVCPCFRQEELGRRHEPEFTMLEWYRADSGSEDVMRDTEELVAECASVLGNSTVTLPERWQRIAVADAFRAHTATDVHQLNDDEFFEVYATQVEPKLGQEAPIFLTEWPARFASLARLLPPERMIADRFEGIIQGIELCNGFGELVDAQEQEERFARDLAQRRRLGKPEYPVDKKFLGALESGIPPSGGNALGVDRLLMLLTGSTRIEDTMAFPESRR